MFDEDAGQLGFMITSEEDGVPFVGVKISREDFDRIKNLKISWWEYNGKKLFNARDEEGNPTEELVAYLIFKE